ncbi:hypothetical protein RRG08_036135 [Elysia crispata]|uniref:Uncharacterized protein n=1 Tax=Elysia crispata TaxID=231223 RepID=A0AAE1DHV7_9GAST|nr:hypothetical protein RRG08_036135 [Elysia crispata]
MFRDQRRPAFPALPLRQPISWMMGESNKSGLGGQLVCCACRPGDGVRGSPTSADSQAVCSVISGPKSLEKKPALKDD